MDLREAKEHLGRVKPYYLRNETLRALASAIMGLKAIVALNIQPAMDVRGLIREAVQLLSRDEGVKQQLTGPLLYQPGQERQILAQLAAAYKLLHEAQSRESYEVAAARKLKLDQHFNAGLKLLEQRQVSEADAEFTETLNYYRDEYRVFAFIGKALVEAGEHRRAGPYLKKGLEIAPTDAELLKLFDQITQLKLKEHQAQGKTE